MLYMPVRDDTTMTMVATSTAGLDENSWNCSSKLYKRLGASGVGRRRCASGSGVTVIGQFDVHQHGDDNGHGQGVGFILTSWEWWSRWRQCSSDAALASCG